MSQLVHRLDDSTMSISVYIIILVASLTVGTISGYVISQHRSSSSGTTSQTPATKAVGIADKKAFKDNAEGTLKEGGIDGEGSFHLERPGGVSQNVYLTSTTVDLSQYVDKKVRVWGATFKGQHAGWLMDVGLVESLQ